jgi:23S rRNA (guanosine2251-2'-O)-methyltransferase
MAQYLYGKNVVKQLLDNGRPIDGLFILAGRTNDPIVQQAKQRGISVSECDRNRLDSLANGNHQGYVAAIADYKTYTIDQITDQIPTDKLPLLIALDSLEDPHNLGAILRSAECVGADGVIIEKNRSVSLNGTVAKVSVGAIDNVKVASVTNLTTTLQQLKKKGYWVCGTAASGSVDYRQAHYDMPLVLVIGSEGFGMRRLVTETCDFTVRLPMFGHLGSLNASVAAGIIMYEIYNQRYPLTK